MNDHQQRDESSVSTEGERSPVRVELLGGFRLLDAAAPALRLPSPRQQQLIAFLALHGGDAPVPRQQIAASLWPESTDAQSLTNLRRELHHLREVAPAIDGLIDAGSGTLAWRGAAATVDVRSFEASAARGLEGDRPALLEAARLYRGDLLPGAEGDWLDGHRERLRGRAATVLAQLVERLERERAFGEAIGYARQLTHLNPFDEQAWCALMRCHARRGERATALHLYQQCAAVLKRELGIQPGAATRLTYREILDLDVAAPPVPAPAHTTTYPLVGRTAEWHTLQQAWQAAAAGCPGLFLIRGEAGMGKTRLAEELVAWCRVQRVPAATTRCYAGEGRLAYAPIAAWLKSEAIQSTLLNLDASWLTDVTRLYPELISRRPEVPAPERELESWQRVRFFESLSHVFRSAAPLVLVVDDLQWADTDTIEWLHFFLRSAGDTPCLVVGTARSDEEQDNPPLGRLLGQLQRDRLLTPLALAPLDAAATAQLAEEVAGAALDEEDQARTFRDTEGHPLFIVELGHMDGSREAGAGGSAGTDVSPVQAVVAARLARLSDEARAVAEVAATVGRDFRFDILAQASDLEEDAVVRALDEMWTRHIVRVQAEERWDFSHDRIREVAYSGIGPARRRLIHRRIAQGMELLCAGRLDDVSAAIAMHLARGGLPGRAMPFLERAAAVATRVSANEEAIRCLMQALSLLEVLPAGRERDDHELSLRASLSVALNSARGYSASEVEENLQRVMALSASGGREPVPVRWLWVAFSLQFMLGDLTGARGVSEEMLARSQSDPACLCEAHHAMGGSLTSVGELVEAGEHFEAALAAYDARPRQQSALASDLGVFAHGWYSHTLWLLGEDASALRHATQAIALARERGHMYSLTLAYAYAALLHQMRRDEAGLTECTNAVADLCARHGFAYYGEWARVLAGWAHGQTDPMQGITEIEAALGQLDARRAQARRPYYLSLLAELCVASGERDRAAAIVRAAVALAETRGERWWLPALYQQQSELEPAPTSTATRERAFALARAQHNAGLERRILAWSPTPGPG